MRFLQENKNRTVLLYIAISHFAVVFVESFQFVRQAKQKVKVKITKQRG